MEFRVRPDSPAIGQNAKIGSPANAARPRSARWQRFQAFLLGMMVAWTPSLVLLGWFLLWRWFRTLGDQPNDTTEKPA